jgi:S13-like protein
LPSCDAAQYRYAAPLQIPSGTDDCPEARIASVVRLKRPVEEAMANPPTLTPEQRQLALQKAAIARRSRAEVKDKLKIGSLSLSELFDAADTKDESGEMLAKLKVVSVLESLPGVGKVRARNIMSELDISESRRLRGLGTNQRRALLEKFGS